MLHRAGKASSRRLPVNSALGVMSFTAPSVTIIRHEVVADDVLTYVAGSLAAYGPPLAPAGLYDQATQAVEHFQLHKLVSQNDDVYTFRTFSAHPPKAPDPGSRFVFRPWWTARAWRIVIDTKRVWIRTDYPDDGSHAHCELTYAGIGAQENNKDGYLSGNDWITCEAYERFVRDDEYHCRDDA